MKVVSGLQRGILLVLLGADTFVECSTGLILKLLIRKMFSYNQLFVGAMTLMVRRWVDLKGRFDPQYRFFIDPDSLKIIKQVADPNGMQNVHLISVLLRRRHGIEEVLPNDDGSEISLYFNAKIQDIIPKIVRSFDYPLIIK